VVKQQEGKLKEYAVVGTGNYHEGTAKIYTDYHLMTADKRITKEVKRVFDFFESNYLVQEYDHLIVSPHYTRTRFVELIDKEIENIKKGLPSGIVLKLNSLSDLKLIDKLYEASRYGVSIRLIIRGICSLIPQVPGLSENIEVISVVDRYLEHTRLFKFMNGGDPKFFISSADWMTRNIDHRVEVTAPIYDKAVKRQMQDHLDLIWKDNVKSRVIGGKEINAYKKNMGPRIRSQIEMYNYLRKVLKKNQLS
jgi:polyphosphate kinase